MALGRRDFLHGILAVPAGGLLVSNRRSAFDSTVRDGADLQAALRAAQPGATIVLAPGDFGDVGLFEVKVPDITLRASVPNCSVLRAPMIVNGDRVKLLDLAFRGEGDDGIYMAGVASCSDDISISSSDVEVRGCDFGYFTGRAILVRPSGLRPYIHDCSFYSNRRNPKSSSANEAVALGYDAANQNVQMRARVINNKFWNLMLEGEVLSVKTSYNTIQGNQVSSSKGGFTNRLGQYNVFQSNTSTNSRGIAVGGRGIRLIGNRVIGTGFIAVQAGNAAPGSTRNSDHPQSVDVYCQGNSGMMIIGGGFTPKPALNTRVASHSGQIRLKLHSGTKLP